MIADQLRLTQMQLSGGSASAAGDNTSSYNGIMANNRGFHWEWFDPKKSIRDVIHYSVKGIMHANGFYPGGNDEWGPLGPNASIPFRFPVQTPSPFVMPEMAKSVKTGQLQH
ncbi:hypothetical protein [Bosea sp. PAMC 26642]|uniref:hypothetical protein n=1 Tax=Bosea sp. (strain PAMC 26642) TaxID=1792307 RepID=UPI00077056A5|nr:hypothetical protein [Bosea sp. PAMC 26642]AMJ62290.1 hypothetical protein AXW83_20075 [Bosea sp. PAMC 26642]